MKFLLAWLALALLAPGPVTQTQTTRAQTTPTQTTRPQPTQTQPAQDRNLIVGAWSLSSYELRLKPSGKVTTPFGPHPAGRILYEANGQMSAQLMRPAMIAFASDDPLRATDKEAASAWRDYIGYWGTYTMDVKAGAITHHIEGGWLPNWAGHNQTRTFQLSGDSLSLDADSPAWHAHLTWKRIR